MGNTYCNMMSAINRLLILDSRRLREKNYIQNAIFE